MDRVESRIVCMHRYKTTDVVDDMPPPLTHVAGASLCLAFHTPSMMHSSAASSRTDYHEQEAISAAGTASLAAIADDSSTRLTSYLVNLAARDEVVVV
jgi:hypothetical protein